MRVLLISHTCQSRREGQPKADALARLPGIELCVLSPDRWRMYDRWTHADAPTDPPFRYEIGRVRLPSVGPAQCYLHYYPKLASLLKEFRPDVIDIWEEPWGLVSAHTTWLRRRICPAAKIISETEQNLGKRLPLPFEMFRRYTLKNADFAVARNSEAVNVIRQKGYRGPAEVVPNAVDADLFQPLDRRRCRDELGLTGFVAGYVGRLVEEKGLMDLVDSLAFCPANVLVLFVGTGPFQQALEQRAASLGKSSQVRFLGSRPLDQLPSVMNALDVLVLPSRTTARWKEQFGRVLIEAAACQTPVIGSSSGAIPDVVGPSGLIFTECDPQALAAQINRLYHDPDLCQSLAIAGRQQVEALYTWQRVAERMYAIYHRVLNKPVQEQVPA